MEMPTHLFFTIQRRRFNRISSIRDNVDNWIHDHEVIKNHMLTHFEHIYQTNDQYDIPLQTTINYHFHITEKEKTSLNLPISPQEIITSIWISSILFFFFFWNISKILFLPLKFYFKKFSILNLYLLALPNFRLADKKTNYFETINQFRPINWCNTVYKILTKIIVFRLRPILNNIIDPLHSSFLPNRHTAGNFILVQETLKCFEKRKSSQTKLMAIKIDLEKAFGKIE